MRQPPFLPFAAACAAVAALVFAAMAWLHAFDACRNRLSDDHPARDSLACHLYSTLGVGATILLLFALALIVMTGIAWLHRRLTTPRT